MRMLHYENGYVKKTKEILRKAERISFVKENKR